MSTRIRRFIRWRYGVAALVSAVAIAGCGDGSGAGVETTVAAVDATPTEPSVDSGVRPVKIGVLAPTSGNLAVFGNDLIDGFQLFIDQSGGTLGGCPVELVTVDTAGNPETGRRVAEKLIRVDDVDLATGVASSAVALAVRDIFHEAEVPIVMANPSANSLWRELRSPYVFSTQATSYMLGAAIADWAYENVSQDRFVVTAPDYAAGAEITDGFRTAFEELGGEVVGEVLPPFGSTEDYQPYLAQIQAMEPAGVFAFYPGGEAIRFVTQYAEFGLDDTIPLIGSGFLVDEVVLGAQGAAALGIRTSAHYSPMLDNPVNNEFRKSFEEAFGRLPISQSFQSYMAGQLVGHALEKVGCDASSVDGMIEAMETVGSLESPGGVFELDPESHAPALSFHLREVTEVDGSYVNSVIEELGVFEDPGE